MAPVTASVGGPCTSILAWREPSASVANFAELMAKPIDRRPPDAHPIGPIETLRFDQVVFRHRSAQENALDGISFRAARGDAIAFVREARCQRRGRRA